MTMYSKLGVPAAGAALMLAAAMAPATADPVADFYKGKQITIVVAVSPGGGYDLNARVLAKHLGRHIPGNPGIVVTNMPGAGGAKSANHMYNVAPRNGTVIAMPLSSIVVAQLLRPQRLKYKAADFNWLGTITTMTDVMTAWHTSGVKSLDDAKKKEIVLGTSSKNSMGYQEPALMNALLGTRIKIIFGYRGGRNMTLAMERGEIQARMNQWASWRVQKPEWLKKGTIVPLIQIGAKDPEYAHVPALIDLVKSDKDKAMVRMLHTTLRIGRSIYTTPGVPAARVAALRRAFDATLEDPAFVKEVKARKLVLNPVRGKDVQAFVNAAMKTPAAVVDRFKATLGYGK